MFCSLINIIIMRQMVMQSFNLLQQHVISLQTKTNVANILVLSLIVFKTSMK